MFNAGAEQEGEDDRSQSGGVEHRSEMVTVTRERELRDIVREGWQRVRIERGTDQLTKTKKMKTKEYDPVVPREVRLVICDGVFNIFRQVPFIDARMGTGDLPQEITQ